jgi:hypothetical protein
MMGWLIGTTAGVMWVTCGLVPMHQYYLREHGKIPPAGVGIISILFGPVSGAWFCWLLWWTGRRHR